MMPPGTTLAAMTGCVFFLCFYSQFFVLLLTGLLNTMIFWDGSNHGLCLPVGRWPRFWPLKSSQVYIWSPTIQKQIKCSLSAWLKTLFENRSLASPHSQVRYFAFTPPVWAAAALLQAADALVNILHLLWWNRLLGDTLLNRFFYPALLALNPPPA